jgi:hypothetical protein
MADVETLLDEAGVRMLGSARWLFASQCAEPLPAQGRAEDGERQGPTTAASGSCRHDQSSASERAHIRPLATR